MKFIKINYILFVVFLILSPFSLVKAQQTSPECQYYPNTITCGGYQDTKSAIEKCDWQKEAYKCCKFNGSPASYMFAKECNIGGYTINEPYKPMCLVGQQCCCHTSATSKTAQTPSVVAPTFPIPDFQIKIDTVKLTKVVCEPDLDKGNSVCPVPWIGEYITGIYSYALSIAGILAAIMLMAGGVIWLISGGDASKITQAKELITGSITGLIILSASYVILYQINPDLTKMKPIMVDYVEAEDLEPASNEGNPNNSKACDDCTTIKKITIKPGMGNQVNAGLAYKLYSAWINSCPSADNCVKWRITEAYPPTGSHESTCHYNGMCVDIGLDPPTDPTDCRQVEKLITVLKGAGLNVLNEFIKCNGTQTKKTTGGHLHVQ